MISSKETKGYVILAIILIIIGYLIYSHFFAGNSGVETTALQNLSGGSQFLPNGSKLDLGPTQQPLFKQLVPPNYPVVSRGEIGNADPFK